MPLDNNKALTEAARITVAFISVYSTALFLQVITKNKIILQHSRNNKSFDRYTSPLLRHVDRMVVNLMEWAFIFLPLVWCLAVVDRLDGGAIRAAWIYVGARAVYVILIMRVGVASNGRNKGLWISTFPAYGCLAHLLSKALPILWAEKE